jgi:hypothetical protein
MTSKLLAAQLGAAAALLVGSFAWAAIPDSSGVIHACYLKSGGALRVIDSAVATCKTQETPLDWNQAGQPGGVSGYQIVSSDPVTLGPGESGEAQVACPEGTRAIGGGYITGPFVNVTSVIPAGGGTVWSAAGRNESQSDSDALRARAVCANVTP